MAIMGASGSGKTTLLQILAGQRIQTSGEVLLDEAKLDAGCKRYIGMVPQDDVLLPTSSVEEAVLFSAAMRLSPSYTVDERVALVSKLIADLGLDAVRSSRIGDTRRRKGISGGEQKRCSIAVELAHRPRVLLLDEPTSGLDSSSAHRLMKLVHELAESQRVAIAFTIHQPSSRDFELFDKLLVLSKGRTVYYGKCKDALTYFERQGFPCPPYTNPAEFILDLATSDKRRQSLINKFPKTSAAAKLQQEMQAINSRIFAKVSETSLNQRTFAKLREQQNNVDACHNAQRDREDGGGGAEGADSASQYATPFWCQFWLLWKRSWLHASRNPVSSRVAASRSISMGLLVGFLFYGVDKTQVSVQDRTGALYFVLTTQIFSAQVFGFFFYVRVRVPGSGSGVQSLRPGEMEEWQLETEGEG